MKTLSADDIRKGLIRLGELALERSLSIELIVVGGAAMALAFHAREPPEMWTLYLAKVCIALRGAAPGAVFVQTRRHMILPGKRITALVMALVVKRNAAG